MTIFFDFLRNVNSISIKNLKSYIVISLLKVRGNSLMATQVFYKKMERDQFIVKIMYSDCSNIDYFDFSQVVLLLEGGKRDDGHGCKLLSG